MCLHYCLRENPAVIGVSVFGCPITRWDGRAIYGATGIVGTVVVVLHDGWCRICPHKKENHIRGIMVLPRFEHCFCVFQAACLPQRLKVLMFLTL